MITKTIEIEELIRKFPFAVKFLMEKGIRCIACGEPIWGTLEEAAIEKGFTLDAIDRLVDEINQIAKQMEEGVLATEQQFFPKSLPLS